MYEKIESCPSCKNTHFQNFHICTDHSVTGESFALSRCTKCDLVITNPRPQEDKLPSYYESENYISHTSKANNPINFIYKLVRQFTIRQKHSLIRKYTKSGKVLDYGCGTGELLHYLSNKGYNCYGFEPSDTAKAAASNKNINLIDNLKNDKNSYDIITAWHVIEHVQDPKKTIKLLRKKLTENGVLFIALPNRDSYDAEYYQENWAAYDVPRHLFHFNQTSFGKLIDKCNLSLIDTLPMKFDSYYVSLLSEKYITNKNSPFKALRLGYKSNQKAKKTGEYSSLIYILKK